MAEKEQLKSIEKRILILIVSAIILSLFVVFKGKSFTDNIIRFVSFSIASTIITFDLYVRFLMVPRGPRLTNIFYQVCDFLSLFAVVCLGFQLFSSFVYLHATVEGTSMVPTLQNEDSLMVRSTRNVDHFDVVVIQVNDKYNIIVPGIKEGDLLVKRIIGVPGDTFYFKDDILYLNHERIDETYLKDEYGEFYYGGGLRDFTLEFYCRIKGENVCPENGECVIPDDYYFVMGDNRTNSNDSKAFGLFHKSQIIGVVKYRVTDIFHWEKVE
jgi:signal peptidase I